MSKWIFIANDNSGADNDFLIGFAFNLETEAETKEEALKKIRAGDYEIYTYNYAYCVEGEAETIKECLNMISDDELLNKLLEGENDENL